MIDPIVLSVARKQDWPLHTHAGTVRNHNVMTTFHFLCVLADVKGFSAPYTVTQRHTTAPLTTRLKAEKLLPGATLWSWHPNYPKYNFVSCGNNPFSNHKHSAEPHLLGAWPGN